MIETARLRLRTATERDLPRLAEHYSRTEVARYLWDGRAVTADELRTKLEGLHLVFAGDDFVGTVGLFPTQPPELLYSLEPEAWGQGYATEAAQALLDASDAETVGAGTDPPNVDSRRVLERLGFEEVGPAEGVDRWILSRSRRGSASAR